MSKISRPIGVLLFPLSMHKDVIMAAGRRFIPSRGLMGIEHYH